MCTTKRRDNGVLITFEVSELENIFHFAATHYGARKIRQSVLLLGIITSDYRLNFSHCALRGRLEA